MFYVHMLMSMHVCDLSDPSDPSDPSLRPWIVSPSRYHAAATEPPCIRGAVKSGLTPHPHYPPAPLQRLGPNEGSTCLTMNPSQCLVED